MNKKELIQCLEICLLNFDGMTKEELEKMFELGVLTIGINLSNHFKDLEIKQ